MKKLLIALALGCASLASCAGLPTPNSVAQQTVLDEKLGIAVTEAYTAASTLGYTLAKAGLIDVARFKALDQQGYDAVRAVRASYLAGNAVSYEGAINDARAAITAIAALAGRNVS